ncbi:mercuric reductase [Ramlibacter algicola]|uniref:Mercuric reductase n=1 Tax=Ramlibacter algicola TaxID=2795217 RepID=A0A934Q1K9_9BURK|nr:mercuric reductase [Ramlibacter algicola]MBK0392609.1 mercuric reductase [Ramlibacter algicola]
MQPEQWDAIVIGAGQAGPALSARLAKAGLRVALVERQRLGGTCVNTGCTPSKTLIASAAVAHLVARAHEFGVNARPPASADYRAVLERVHAVSDESRAGLGTWLASIGGLTVILGNARFVDSDTVSVGKRQLRAPRIFLNVGCRPVEPPWARAAGVQFLTTDTFFDLRELPSDLLIVGGGPVGLELGQALQRLGSNVTVVERAARLLPREDEDAAKVIQDSLVADGVRFFLSADCFHLERGSTGPCLTFLQGRDRVGVEGSHVLVAVGRQPNTADLGLDEAGVAVDERGFIKTDGQLRTTQPGVWALGDANGRGAFTHTSWNDYEIVAGAVLDGEQRSVEGRAARYAVFTDPPLARIGASTQEASRTGKGVLTGVMPMTRVRRAVERGDTRGFMRVLADADTGQVLGATFVCASADEVIHPLVNAMSTGTTVRQLAAIPAIHPTISELVPTLLQQLQPLASAISPA